MAEQDLAAQSPSAATGIARYRARGKQPRCA
jgi:hypothetical protein